jgi:poly(glycerol-phosphate) alpha-glucosyltransferase
VTVRFPEANYFIAGSRLRPGMDGGYTVSSLRRAMQFQDHAGVNPVLLTFDFWPDYAQVKRDFINIGLMTQHTVIRNLFQDARDTPQFLHSALVKLAEEITPPRGERVETTDVDFYGRPWRTIVADAATGRTLHTDFLTHDGRPLLRIPYVTGRPDWHRAPISIMVFGDDGEPIGTIDGFGSLYRLWLEHVLDTSPGGRCNMVVCESRQVGEMLVDVSRDDLRIIHTVHSTHTAAPYRWDSPLDTLWASWFEVMHRFDAVVWLTQRQREDVERRFGLHDETFAVVPHALDQVQMPSERRDPDLAVMIGRLATLKRVDHALRAFRLVLNANPAARLDIYGDGPDETRLRALVEELGMRGSVRFLGHRANAADCLARAAVLVFASTYEGQGLVLVEALAHGCPVVSYDVNYGPSDIVSNGENGLLVSNGDIAGLGAALSSVLGNKETIAALSAGALMTAEGWTAEHSMASMANVFERVLHAPPRR